MSVHAKQKYKSIIASRGVIYLPKKIKAMLGIKEQKSILISIENNKIIIEIEHEKKEHNELRMKKKNTLNFIENFNLEPKENISVEEFLNESRRY